jgi:hypothetical protein
MIVDGLSWHRHRMVRARTRIMNQLQAVALNEGLRCKQRLWRERGRQQLESFPLAPWASRRRDEHFLFLAGSFTNSGDDGIYLSSLSGKEKSLVILTDSNPGYANGYLFYVDEKRSLRAIPVDLSKGKTSGESEVVAEEVGFQPCALMTRHFLYCG